MKNLITIRLPEKMQKELENLSKIEGKPKSEIVRDALNQYLTMKKFEQLRKKFLLRDRSLFLKKFVNF